jgi:putative copper resistance protein D
MLETGLAAARWLQFAVAMLLCGVPTFCLYGMAPAARAAERLWLRRLLVGAIAAGLIAALLLLMTESAEMSGDPVSAVDPATIWSVVSGTYFGAVWLARLALLAAFAILIFSASAARVGWLAILGLAATASLAWQGHGGEGGAALGIIHRAADVAHLVAASIWIGALVVLAHLLSRASRNPDVAPAALYGLTRFSGIGALVVATLIASGLINAWALTAPRPILEALATPYAFVLGGKLALFVGMLGLAALNRYTLTPLLEQSLAGDVEVRAAIAGARWSVAIETSLAVLVLVAVSVLGVMEPPNAG